jgi:CHAD domain-containing protein
MKDTLVYLTHLDPVDTENIMLDRLAKQVRGRDTNLYNTLREWKRRIA